MDFGFSARKVAAVDLEPVLDHRNYMIICILYILNVGSTGLISGVVGPPINGLINGLITGVKKPLLIGVMRLFVLW